MHISYHLVGVEEAQPTAGQQGWNPRLAASSFCEQPGEEGVCAGGYQLMPMGINLFTTLGVCAIGG